MRRHGGVSDLLRTEVIGGGPSDPTGGEEVVTAYPLRVLNWGINAAYAAGTLVERGDRFAMVEALEEITPRLTDMLKLAGREFNIIEVQRIAPDPDAAPIAWRLQLRGPA